MSSESGYKHCSRGLAWFTVRSGQRSDLNPLTLGVVVGLVHEPSVAGRKAK